MQQIFSIDELIEQLQTEEGKTALANAAANNNLYGSLLSIFFLIRNFNF